MHTANEITKAIDTATEDLIELADATKAFPGRHISIQTLHRWRQYPGVRGAVLATILVGGIRYTSHQAIARFVAAQNAADQSSPAITPQQRRRQGEAAMKTLQESGI